MQKCSVISFDSLQDPSTWYIPWSFSNPVTPSGLLIHNVSCFGDRWFYCIQQVMHSASWRAKRWFDVFVNSCLLCNKTRTSSFMKGFVYNTYPCAVVLAASYIRLLPFSSRKYYTSRLESFVPTFFIHSSINNLLRRTVYINLLNLFDPKIQGSTCLCWA